MRKAIVGKGFWSKYHKEIPEEQHPWNHYSIDPDIWAALQSAADPILEIGIGNGYQFEQLLYDKRDAYGTEISSAPIERVKSRIGDIAIDRLFVDDIRSTAIDRQFQTIIDRGVFHVLNPEERNQYARSIGQLLDVEGLLLIKAFSHLEPGIGRGPYRLSDNDFRAAFEPDFEIVSAKNCRFQFNRSHYNGHYPQAVLVVIKWANKTLQRTPLRGATEL